VTDIGGVGQSLVEDFLVSLAVGSEKHSALSLSSAARTLAAVRGLHGFAVAEGWRADDPTAQVAPPRVAGRLPKAIPLAAVEALIAAAGAGEPPLGLRDTALVELLYGTGARISEAVALDVDDLPTEEPVLLLRGKGDKERLVPMGRLAMAAIEAYLVSGRPLLASRGTSSAALFLNARGGRLTRQSGWGVLRRAAQRAQLDVEVSPHTLRHSFATHMLDGGADVRVVQELLGHASVTTTQVYTLVTAQRLAEEYATSHPRAR
jgi:integrase/recombinase XerD